MVAFSDREVLILDTLGRRRMTYSQIADEIFSKRDKPLDAEIAVGNSVRRIMMKCEAGKLSFQLVKKKINGYMTVWRITI